MSRTFVILEHQHKAKPYLAALKALGWRQVPHQHPTPSVDLMLLDVDYLGHEQFANAYGEKGAAVVLYPHGANPLVGWDAFGGSRYTVGSIEIGEGQAEVRRRYHYPKAMYITGWAYSPRLGYKPTLGERVLFAPHHPNTEGYLPPVEQAENAAIFEKLLSVRHAQNITVRYIGELGQNGLSKVTGVNYVRATTNGLYEEILQADVVISTGTHGFISVALGKPTVFFSYEFDSGLSLPHLDNYRDYARFPLQCDNAESLPEFIEMATRTDETIAQWRRLFIGDPFSVERMKGAIDAIFCR